MKKENYLDPLIKLSKTYFHSDGVDELDELSKLSEPALSIEDKTRKYRYAIFITNGF